MTFCRDSKSIERGLTYCDCSEKSLMPRRGDREADHRWRPSRFDREPSPKRSRRDGKPAIDRKPSDTNAGPREHVERDNKSDRQLQEPLPLEAPLSSKPKVETEPISKESQRKGHSSSEGVKPSSDPIEVPPSKSYFQHDERGIAGSGVRGFSQRSTSDRGLWKDAKDEHVKESDWKATNSSRRNDGSSRRRDGDTRVWRHDGFFEMEANPNLPLPPPPPPPPLTDRKRPAFREHKVPTGNQDTPRRSKADAIGPNSSTGRPDERKEDRSRYSNNWERHERWPNKRDDSRGDFPPRSRFGGGTRDMGRDTYNGRHGFSRLGGNDTKVEKWKHDLFDEANKSPSPKNEEDRIAKIEALLAS